MIITRALVALAALGTLPVLGADARPVVNGDGIPVDGPCRPWRADLGKGAGARVGVSDFDQLSAAVTQHVPSILLTADIVFTATLVITHDCVLVAVDDTVVDLNAYSLVFTDSTFSIGDMPHALSFTNGTTYVQSVNTYTACTFYRCAFSNAPGGNGLALFAGTPDLDVACIACQADHNYLDGYNVHNGSATPGTATLSLINCSAEYNDACSIGGPAGDGATAHDPNQRLYIEGGNYRNNGKSGVAMVGGSTLVVTGAAVFRSNGGVVDLADVYAENFSRIEWNSGCADVVRAAANAEIHVIGFGFLTDELLLSGYFRNWSPCSLHFKDAVSAGCVVLDTIAIPGDTNTNGVLDLADV